MRQGIASFLGLGMLCLTANGVGADDGPPKPVAELKVLERYVGSWESESTFKPSAWMPKGGKAKSAFTTKWTLDGRFVEGTSKDEDKVERMWLTTYDPHKKAYRGWYFDSMSTITESRGQWDEETKTMTMTGSDPEAGLTSKSTSKFIDKDTVEYTLVVKDKEGKVMWDQVTKSTRKK